MTGFKKYKKKNMSNAKKIKSLERKVAKINNNIEVKHITYTRAYAISAANDATDCFNKVAQGIDDLQRIGDFTTLKHLDVLLFADVQTTSQEAYFRFIVYNEAYNLGNAVFDPTHMFVYSDTQIAKIGSIFNPDFVGKGKELRIKYDSGPVRMLGGLSGNNKWRIAKHFRLGLKCDYTLNVNANANAIQYNAIKFVMISSSANMNWGLSSFLEYTDE